MAMDAFAFSGSLGFNSGASQYQQADLGARCGAAIDPYMPCATPQHCRNNGRCMRVDPNVIDLPADAVREVKDVPLLDAPEAE